MGERTTIKIENWPNILGGSIGDSVEKFDLTNVTTQQQGSAVTVTSLSLDDVAYRITSEQESKSVVSISVETQEYDQDGWQYQLDEADRIASEIESLTGITVKPKSNKKKKVMYKKAWSWKLDTASVMLSVQRHQNFAGDYSDLRLQLSKPE